MREVWFQKERGREGGREGDVETSAHTYKMLVFVNRTLREGGRRKEGGREVNVGNIVVCLVQEEGGREMLGPLPKLVGKGGKEGRREGGREDLRQVHFLGQELKTQADRSRGHALGRHGNRNSGGATTDFAQAGGN